MCSFETINTDILANAEITIVCPTYNHIRYIKECINSLISQKTSFQYGVLIHDDASTDGTAEVVKEYCSAYPDKVCAILEKENLYSKGMTHRDVVKSFLAGHYVAICEGDDFWISARKLQLQYEFMSQHPEYSLSLHQAFEYNDSTKRETRIRSFAEECCDISLDDILSKWALCGATNTIMMKRELYVFPDAFSGWGVGDYPAVIYAAIEGKVRYISHCLSAYRTGVAGSWTSNNGSRGGRLVHTERLIQGLSKADAFSSYCHHKEFEITEDLLRLEMLALQRHGIKLIEGYIRLRQTRHIGLSKFTRLLCKCLLPDSIINILINMNQLTKRR